MKIDLPNQSICTVLNRMKFIDDETFQIVSEDGIEKIIHIDDGFKELEFNYRPLFTTSPSEEYMEFHYYTEREFVTAYDSTTWLKRKYQQYKTSYYLKNKRTNTQMYGDLIGFDMSYSYIYTSNSFTYIHWTMIEQISRGELKFSQLDQKCIEQLLLTILPGGNTILHLLCDKEDALIELMQIAHSKDGKILLHMPFIPNIDGETPIHRCIKKSDFKSIDVMLKYLKLYPIDHHSRAIKDLYQSFIDQKLPEFIPYLDSRLLQTQQLRQITKGSLIDDCPEFVVSQLWFDQNTLQEKIMKPKPIENRILCEILDMPGIYHQNDKDFLKFYQSLASTDEPDYFNKKAIQKLIEFNYPLVKEYIIIKLFGPFCVFQLCFSIFQNLVMENKALQGYQQVYFPLLAVNLIFAVYFIHNEIRQFCLQGTKYFQSYWNYIDMIPPLGIFAFTIITVLSEYDYEIDEATKRSIQAITTFFMWFKFLYFLRIFRSTSYLITMIFEVIYDMRFFFAVLLITMIAFGDSFLSISYGNNELDRFTHSFTDSIIYTYRMILGDFETDKFGEVAKPLVIILFLLCTIFNMIVMLNLLIAIISESFARITAKADQAVYQEMASMIAENSYLIPASKKRSYAEQNQYLLIVNDLEQIEIKISEQAMLDQVKNEIMEEIRIVKEQNETMHKTLLEKINLIISENKK
ncbi:wd-40 repeat protein [Stylonychia lemnae]|uniref:Wd-40 repeat protein n=1 Tax=Stylonychia lemnae TaxID=5949 RepID=A0A078AS47_STYLE|nr:wd-40 repeat protein [Stylonychia lemnae]|eukprot:CDW84989.1 wd-40 repeat protein [Stylonychia lemnae]